MTRTRRSALLAACSLCAALLSGCVEAYLTVPAAPTGLTATGLGALPPEQDRIVLAWQPAAGAGIYFVYRSADGAAFPFLAETVYAEYVDTRIDPETPYSYRVTAAAALDRGRESPASAVVQGQSSHLFQWSSISPNVPQNAGNVGFDFDREASGAPDLYYAYADASLAESVITVLRYDRSLENPVWAALGDPFGAVDGTKEGAVALAVSGHTAYAAYRDAVSGTAVVVKYTETADDARNRGGFLTVSATAGAPAIPAAPSLSLAVFQGIPCLVYLDAGGLLRVARAGTVWEALGGAVSANPAEAPLLVASGTVLILAYRDLGADASAAGLADDTVRVARWDGSAFAEILSAPEAGPFSLDAAGDRLLLAVVRLPDGGIVTRLYDGSAWSTLLPEIPGLPTADSVAASLGRVPCVLYQDEASRKTGVRTYAAGAWSAVSTETEPGDPPSSEWINTSSSVTGLALASQGAFLYAAYRVPSLAGGTAQSSLKAYE